MVNSVNSQTCPMARAGANDYVEIGGVIWLGRLGLIRVLSLMFMYTVGLPKVRTR